MVRKLLLGSLIDETRGTTYVIVFGIWAMVAVYSIAHDQYIVRIAPEHFTVYHAPVWNLTDPRALAAAWAFKASLIPGFLLGFAALVVGRLGTRPQVPVRYLLMGAATVIGLSEVVCAASGLWAHRTEALLYPERVYPETTGPLLVTQTIQITCYLASAAFSAMWLCGLGFWRWHRRTGR